MDKRSETSAENGKKGGRPISEATLRAQAAKEYISKQTADSLGAIVAKAVTQAIEGDYKAREWLSDRGWGKAVETIVTEDEFGEKQPITGMIIAKDGNKV